VRLPSVQHAQSSPARCCYVCSWAPAQLSSSGSPGSALLARRLLRQGLQLGVVGLLTGLAGSAAAQQLARWQRCAAAKQHQDSGDQVDSQTASDSSDVLGRWAPGKRTPRLRAAVLRHSALQRVLFMALSANMRSAALYAAEDRLWMYTGAPAVVHAARALLHGANSLLAAAQWRDVSSHIYAGC
jgi:hypothetical protein